METALFSLKLTIGPVCVCATKQKLSQLENVELLNLKIKQPLCVAQNEALRALRPMGFQVGARVTVLVSGTSECGTSESNLHVFSVIISCS